MSESDRRELLRAMQELAMSSGCAWVLSATGGELRLSILPDFEPTKDAAGDFKRAMGLTS